MSSHQGKSNFKQIEVQGKIEEVEKQLNQLRLVLFAAEILGQGDMTQVEMEQMKHHRAALEEEQTSLKRQLRKLQLNQIRQKNFRERKKQLKGMQLVKQEEGASWSEEEFLGLLLSGVECTQGDHQLQFLQQAITMRIAFLNFK
jgi:hypothetical protein